jgi:hypothetical protein
MAVAMAVSVSETGLSREQRKSLTGAANISTGRLGQANTVRQQTSP